MGNLVPVGKSDVLYTRMQTAIADCYSIDDCKDIATQAQAVAAYFAQIDDDESVKKFLQVKIRAWRRIGEILTHNVDRSGCDYPPGNHGGRSGFNAAAYVRKIRAKFKNGEIERLSEHDIRQAVKIAEVPIDFFNANIMECGSIDSIVGAFSRFQRREWEKTPEGQAALEAEEARRAEDAKREEEMRPQREEQQRLEKEKREAQEAELMAKQADLRKLSDAQEEAFKEVGVTLDRRDRHQMKQIVFLLKEPIHAVLRRAAFDKHMTMQAILRSGLMMWFIAQGYNVSIDDMNLPRQQKRHDHAQ